jgi:hypothetical protein
MVIILINQLSKLWGPILNGGFSIAMFRLPEATGNIRSTDSSTGKSALEAVKPNEI